MEGDIVIHAERPAKKGWKKVVLIVISSLVVLALVVVAVVVGVNFATRRRDVVIISNAGELWYPMPGKAQEEFGGYLYNLLRQNFDVPEDGASIKATVRPETYDLVSHGNINTVKFVVDVEDYQQSFNAVMSWSDTLTFPESARIECTTKEESKWPEVKCYGMTTTSESISIYLPHDFELATGQKVKLEYGFTTNDGKDIIDVTVSSCGDAVVDEEALSSARSWVKAQGADADAIEFRMHPAYENCVIKGGS